MSRPSTYTPEVGQLILDRIADGQPLRVICREDGMPAWRTVYTWRAADPEFDARFAPARAMGHDAIAEETLEIADERTDDPASRRVRVETRLKLLAKWDPKRYGDRQQVDHTSSDGSMSSDAAVDKLAALVAQVKERT